MRSADADTDIKPFCCTKSVICEYSKGSILSRSISQHLLSSSCHPQHTIKTVPFSSALRLAVTNRRSVDKTNIKSKPTIVAEHFLSHPNHCHTDMQLIPLEIIHSSRDSIRKARESFLIDLARTLEPHGMNRRDES